MVHIYQHGRHHDETSELPAFPEEQAGYYGWNYKVQSDVKHIYWKSGRTRA
jgi:hypothetical protein